MDWSRKVQQRRIGATSWGVLSAVFLASAVVAIASAGPVWANTGMENVAYGAKSAGMGGTSIAVGDDATVMNTNPASISRTLGGRIDMNMEVMFPMFSFQNPLNDTAGNHPVYPIPSAGLVYHSHGSRWSFGIGMFNEGGTGTDYGKLAVDNDVLGPSIGLTRVRYFSQFGYMKLTPTVALEISDGISVGVSPQLGYSRMKMEMPFFEPSMNRFWAAQMEADSPSVGVKVGLLYRVSDRYGVGVAYSSTTDIRLKGDLYMATPTGDLPGMPKRSVMKGDLEMDMGWPQSLKFGGFVKLQTLGGMVVASDVEWLDWSHYYGEIPLRMREVTLNGRRQPARSFTMGTGWADQWVFKLGLEYPVTERFRIRGGYVYGKNPAKSEGALAVMNPFVEHHLTAGVGYDLSRRVELNGSVVYGLNKTLSVGRYHPFAPDMMNSRTGMEFVSLSLMLSYKW